MSKRQQYRDCKQKYRKLDMIILTGRRILLYDNVLRPGFIYRRNIVKSTDIIVNGKQKCLDNV